jgi:hypothetical protein
MLPEEVDTLGRIYPIRLKDWEKFNKLSNFLFIHGLQNLKNLYQFKGEYVLDYIINENAPYFIERKITKEFEEQIEKCTEEEQIILKKQLEKVLNNIKIQITMEDIEENFSLIFREEVKFDFVITEENGLDYCFRIGKTGKALTKYNYDILREIVMKQNIMYEPLTSPDKLTNEIFKKTMEAKIRRNRGKTRDFESIIALVSIERGISDEEIMEYTYYRLMKDYNVIVRKHNNIYSAIFMSVGNKMTLNSFDEEIEMYHNPYDDIFGEEISEEEIMGALRE